MTLATKRSPLSLVGVRAKVTSGDRLGRMVLLIQVGERHALSPVATSLWVPKERNCMLPESLSLTRLCPVLPISFIFLPTTTQRFECDDNADRPGAICV